MARTRVRWRRVAALAIAAAAVVGVAGRSAASGSPAHDGGRGRPDAARTYVVRPGDTLWGIAVRILGPTADPRPLVDAMVDLNQVNQGIVPGETLRIPTAT